MIVLAVLVVWTVIDHGGISARTPLFITVIPLLLLIVKHTLCQPSDPYRHANGWYRLRTAPDISPLPWPTRIGLLLVAIGYIELIELPRNLLTYIAPGTDSIHENWASTPMLQDLVGADEFELSEKLTQARLYDSISVSPWQTRLAISSILSFSLFCWLSSQLCWTKERVRRLLGFFAMLGVFLSIFGAADHLVLARDWQHELRARLWITPVGADSPFATFVNSNNAAGFLHLCLACALGFFCVREQAASKASGTFSDVLAYGAILIITVGIFSTESRGASVAWITGAIAFCMMNLKRWSLKQISFGVCTLVIATGLFINSIGSGQTTFDRLRSLIDGRVLENVRLAHWSDAITASLHFLPFGAGLGTYGYAYLPFQTEGSARWFVNADGMPIEWFLETGVIGMILLPVSTLLLLAQLRRLNRVIRHAPNQGQRTLAGAMKNMFVYLVPALVVSQCFDFGITLPSLFLLLALLLGVLHSIPSSEHSPNTPKTSRHPATRLKMRRFLAGAAFLMMLFATYDTVTFQVMRYKLQVIERSTADNRRLPAAEWKTFESEEKQLREWSLQNHSEVHRILSNVIVRNAQQRVYRDYVNENLEDEAEQDTIKAGLFSLQMMRKIHYRVNNSAHESGIAEQRIAQLITPKGVRSDFSDARTHAIHGLLGAPLEPMFKLRLIELDFLTSSRTTSATLIEQTRRLRMGDHAVNRYVDQLQSIAGEEP